MELDKLLALNVLLELTVSPLLYLEPSLEFPALQVTIARLEQVFTLRLLVTSVLSEPLLALPKQMNVQLVPSSSTALIPVWMLETLTHVALATYVLLDLNLSVVMKSALSITGARMELKLCALQPLSLLWVELRKQPNVLSVLLVRFAPTTLLELLTAQLVNSALENTLLLETFLIAQPVTIVLKGLQLNLNVNLELSKLLPSPLPVLLALQEASAWTVD